MRPGTGTKINVKQTNLEEKIRKSLYPLQLAATDKENLVGAGRQACSVVTMKDKFKNDTSEKIKGDIKKTVDLNVILKTTGSKKIIEKLKGDSKNFYKDEQKQIKMFKDHSVQTEFKDSLKLFCEELTAEAEPSENYWKVVAERRQVALQTALKENEMLLHQLKIYKEMLNESRSLVEILQDLIGEDTNGINNSLEDI